jgi:hypothetical protein
MVSSFPYKFSTSVVDSDPGAGYLKANNADLTLPTFIWVDYINDNAVDLANFLES